MGKYTLHLDSAMPFGKYKGYTLREIGIKDLSYLYWLYDKSDADLGFDPYTIDFSEDDKREYDEILLGDYLDNHPNPFNLERWELKAAVLSNITRVKKVGNPTVDDWDDEVYQKPEYKNVVYGNA